MSYKATWEDMGNEIVNGSWRTGDHISATQAIKALGNDYIQIALLLDIAKSLRVLRCVNFKDIPNKLDRIDRKLKARRNKKKIV